MLAKDCIFVFSKYYMLRMKKLLFLFFFGYAIGVNAQIMNLINPDKSSSYYQTRGIKKVFFKSPRTLIKNTPMPVSTKANEFIVVSEEYGKDKQYIFWGNKKLLNGDIATFDWNSRAELPFDKDFLYEGIPNKDRLIPIENVDKNSYERVKLNAECLIWHKDINHYYYNHKVTNANLRKLSFESEYLPFDDVYIFMVDGKDWKPYRYTGKVRVVANNIVYDDKYLIISGICGEKNSKLNEIEIDDPAELIFDIEDKSIDALYSDLVFKTGKYIFYKGIYLYLSGKENITDLSLFKELGKNYYRYIKKIYFNTEKGLIEIPGADSHTFELLKDGYSKDAKQVYYKGQVVADADAGTFAIETRFYYQYEWDKNNIYKNGRVVSTDAKNFKVLSGRYSKDSFKAYYNFYEIKGADARTFELVGSRYAKDKNHVYLLEKVLEGYEPAKFVKDKCGRLPDSPNYGDRCPSSSSGRSSRWSRDDD